MEITTDQIIELPLKASTAISEAIYDQQERTLLIVMGTAKAKDKTFGQAITYRNVPLSVALGLVSADSVGSYYNGSIKGLYPADK